MLEKRYGVDRTIIVAIWGVELNYGTQPGDMNVIRSLATLAYYNTKASFARQQLITALKIVQRGDIRVEADERLLGRRHGPHAIHPHHLSSLCRRL